jgi:hypothetical protein
MENCIFITTLLECWNKRVQWHLDQPGRPSISAKKTCHTAVLFHFIRNSHFSMSPILNLDYVFFSYHASYSLDSWECNKEMVWNSWREGGEKTPCWWSCIDSCGVHYQWPHRELLGTFVSERSHSCCMGIFLHNGCIHRDMYCIGM